jgi:hypothetical protein
MVSSGRVLLLAAALAGGACATATTTGGTGPVSPPSPGPAGGGSAAPEVALEIVEVDTPSGDTDEPTFVAPAEEASIRARVSRAPEREGAIRWQIEPVGSHTGPGAPSAAPAGATLVFRGASRLPATGSREPNPPLEYEVVASLADGGDTLEAPVLLRQLERDVLRQEYVDYATQFRPGPDQVGPPARVVLNRGNYSVVAEEVPGGLAALLDELTVAVRGLMASDVQVVPVGRTGLDPQAVVVEPGPPVLRVGRLGSTDPKGDDVCAGPLVGGRCAGPVRAGPNGTAETRANNRGISLDLSRAVTSAFRNPQRNRAVGSKALNSRHTRGRALDLDPRVLAVPGRTSAQMMCVLEAAGDAVAGPSNSFTEKGATTFLACDSPLADHVHVQR